MFAKIASLREKGYTPSCVIDIGAYHGLWTDAVKNIFPDSYFVLFEAIDYQELDRFRSCSDTRVYKNVILNEKEELVDWYEGRNTGDSFRKERTRFYVGVPPIRRTSKTLDQIVSQDEILKTAPSIFLKIDCQGAEIPILKGARTLLNRVDFLLLEMPLFGQYNEGVPSFLEHVKFLDELGFIPFDIVDNHYFNGFNMQVDMLFIRKDHEFNEKVQALLY